MKICQGLIIFLGGGGGKPYILLVQPPPHFDLKVLHALKQESMRIFSIIS